jgi:hypothetical protein
MEVGLPLEKDHVVAPVAMFFEKVARVDPEDPSSTLEGRGRFRIEAYLLSLCGVPVQSFNKAQLICARWLFDSILPFAMLVVFSLVTRRTDPDVVDAFYAKMRTPVHDTPEEDRRIMEAVRADPVSTEKRKLLPRSDWEFRRWDKQDTVGFFVCWAFVAVFLVFLYFLVNVGGS